MARIKRTTRSRISATRPTPPTTGSSSSSSATATAGCSGTSSRRCRSSATARSAPASGAGGRPQEAGTLYRQILQTRRSHLGALRGCRELAVEAGEWRQVLDLQHRILGAVGATERAQETEWLAVAYYELGRAELTRGNASAALPHLKNAVRADRRFLPGVLALGDAHEMVGEHRDAVRAWERAAEVQPALPLLARLERAYREEGRPTRMIALYRTAIERAPDALSLAVALGR